MFHPSTSLRKLKKSLSRTASLSRTRRSSSSPSPSSLCWHSPFRPARRSHHLRPTQRSQEKGPSCSEIAANFKTSSRQWWFFDNESTLYQGAFFKTIYSSLPPQLQLSPPQFGHPSICFGLRIRLWILSIILVLYSSSSTPVDSI